MTSALSSCSSPGVGSSLFQLYKAGLITLEEAIRYRLETDRVGPVVPTVLAGPTCDSADVLYERIPVDLPDDLVEGDEVRFLSAGAYTSCYSTVGFNGFEPLPTVLV